MGRLAGPLRITFLRTLKTVCEKPPSQIANLILRPKSTVMAVTPQTGTLNSKSVKIQNQNKTNTSAQTTKYKVNTKLTQNQGVRRALRAAPFDVVLVLYWFCILSFFHFRGSVWDNEHLKSTVGLPICFSKKNKSQDRITNLTSNQTKQH